MGNRLSKKRIMKSLGLIVVAGLAIGINVVGYQKSRQDQYDQRVAQAMSSIKNQAEQIDKIQTSLNATLLSANTAFLRPDLTLEELDKIETEINQLKVSAADFSVEVNDLPKESLTFATKKDDLKNQHQVLVSKLRIEEAIRTFFEAETLDWQTVETNAAINDTVTLEQLKEVQEDVTRIPEDQWQQNLTSYLDLAQEQLEEVANVQAFIDTLFVDGQVTDAATYGNYLELDYQVNQIASNSWRAQLKQAVDEIATQIGLY